MMSVTISKEWFEEIKNNIKYENEYFYIENNRERVEVDVDAEEFNRVSREFGWIDY